MGSADAARCAGAAAATAIAARDAAKLLGVSTGNLIAVMQTEPKVWEQANLLRQRFGHKALKAEG